MNPLDFLKNGDLLLILSGPLAGKRGFVDGLGEDGFLLCRNIGAEIPLSLGYVDKRDSWQMLPSSR